MYFQSSHLLRVSSILLDGKESNHSIRDQLMSDGKGSNQSVKDKLMALASDPPVEVHVKVSDVDGEVIGKC